MKWIPANKELPQNLLPVLVWLSFPDDEYEIDIAFYHRGRGEWRYNDYEGALIANKIVAWMPLPKPVLED